MKGKGTTIIGCLFPFVMGVCSNLPDENPPCRFFMASEVNDYTYLGKFVEYLEHLAKKAARLCEQRFAKLKLVIEHHLQQARFSGNKYGIRIHEENLKKLHDFIHSLPILGYNSSAFDSKVIRQFVIPCLIDRYGIKNISVRCKGCKYTLLQTPYFRLIDQMNVSSCLDARVFVDARVFSI